MESPPEKITELTGRGRFIGMDEAGYGPNLGPLVIVATVWESPDRADYDLAKLLDEVVDVKNSCNGTKLHIADSKLVNGKKNGFRSLETSALALLMATGARTATFHELWNSIDPFHRPDGEVPWHAIELSLPVQADSNTVQALGQRLMNAIHDSSLKCQEVQGQIVTARQFNLLLGQHASKGVLLSKLAFELLGRVWKCEDLLPTLFIGDKHGGRNRYDELLAEIVGEAMIFRIEEGQLLSRYRVNLTELRFQAKGEQHFQVAAASVIAKYIRELAMIQFNKFWNQYCPGIQPTKGYPVDAARFRHQIRRARKKLGISDEILWRAR